MVRHAQVHPWLLAAQYPLLLSVAEARYLHTLDLHMGHGMAVSLHLRVHGRLATLWARGWWILGQSL